MKQFTQAERLECGCALEFLPLADKSAEIPHEKPQSLLDAYNELLVYHPTITPKRILEIGVKHGGSLAMFHDRFRNAEIIGIDHLPQITVAAEVHFAHIQNVRIITGSVSNELFATLEGQFDIVIDDGSHIFADTICAFNALWSRVTHGGLYIIEDWRVPSADHLQILSAITTRMAGYWPSPDPSPEEPRKLSMWRDMIAIEKPL